MGIEDGDALIKVRTRIPEPPRKIALSRVVDADILQGNNLAGFEQIEIEPWRVYDMTAGKFASAFIRAQKPKSATCCGPEYCKT